MSRVRLISLAAQKTLASVCHDAYQMQKRKQLNMTRRQRNAAPERPVLTSEILSEALQEVSIISDIGSLDTMTDEVSFAVLVLGSGCRDCKFLRTCPCQRKVICHSSYGRAHLAVRQQEESFSG